MYGLLTLCSPASPAVCRLPGFVERALSPERAALLAGPRITQQPRLVRCVPSLRRVQERPDYLRAHQRDVLDDGQLCRAGCSLLGPGCNLDSVLSGICCGARRQ